MRGHVAVPLIAVAYIFALPSVSAAQATLQPCPNAHGAPFSFTAPGGAKMSGAEYQVFAQGVSCAMADSLVSKLTAATPGVRQPDGGNLLDGAPSGWKCEGKSYTYTRHEPPTISGLCVTVPESSAAKGVRWGVARG